MSFRYDVGDFGLALTDYSRVSGLALIAPAAPEAMADSPMTWVPGSDRWGDLLDSLTSIKASGHRIEAARYSPDGSLLAVAAAGKIYVRDVRTGSMRTFQGPKQYVWALCVSPDNAEVCWTDTGYVRAMGGLPTEADEVTLDPYQDSGYGILTLSTGQTRYRRLSDEKQSTAAGLVGWPPPPQTEAMCAFSSGGRRLYFAGKGLVCLERSSGRMWSVAGRQEGGPWICGAALMPSSESETLTRRAALPAFGGAVPSPPY